MAETLQDLNVRRWPPDAPGATLQSEAQVIQDNFVKLAAASPATVAEFGAVGDGVTDDTTAILAAIAAAKAAGGGTVYLPPGAYKITATLDLADCTGVRLVGAGRGHKGDSQATYPTRIVWAGSSGGTMVKFRSTSTALSIMSSAALIGLTLDCASLAGTGVEITSVRFCEFGDLQIVNPTSYGMHWTCLADKLNSGASDPADNQHNSAHDIYVFAVSPSSGTKAIFLDGNAGTGVATVAANTSLNRFENIFLNIRDGDGFVFGYSDGNVVDFLRVYRPGGNSGIGLTFEADAGATARHARHNHVLSYEGGASNARAKAGAGTSSTLNTIIGYSTNNGAGLPTIDSGAKLQYLTSEFLARFGALKMVLADSLDASGWSKITAELAAMGNESLRIRNDSDNHLKFVISGAGAEWGINVQASTGDLRLTRTVGSGIVQVNGGLGVGGTKVIGTRKTGWSTATGTPTRTSFDTATVTLAQLAERVKALIDDLHGTAGHGLIGT